MLSQCSLSWKPQDKLNILTMNRNILWLNRFFKKHVPGPWLAVFIFYCCLRWCTCRRPLWAWFAERRLHLDDKFFHFVSRPSPNWEAARPLRQIQQPFFIAKDTRCVSQTTQGRPPPKVGQPHKPSHFQHRCRQQRKNIATTRSNQPIQLQFVDIINRNGQIHWKWPSKRSCRHLERDGRGQGG